MSAPDRIKAWVWNLPYPSKKNGTAEWNAVIHPADQECNDYLRADGPTITAYREALRLLKADPDSIAREAEKEAQNG